MAEKKRFVVKGNDIVYVSSVDKQEFLQDGDFVAPPSGFYSEIESYIVPSHEFQKKFSLITLLKIYPLPGFEEYLPFEIYIFYNFKDNKYIYKEIFNINKEDKYELKTLIHYYLDSSYNVKNYNQKFYELIIEFEPEDFRNFFNSIDKFKLYMEWTVTQNSKTLFFRKIIELNKNSFASVITNKQLNIYKHQNVLSLLQITEFYEVFKKLIYDNIYNNAVVYNKPYTNSFLISNPIIINIPLKSKNDDRIENSNVVYNKIIQCNLTLCSLLETSSPSS